MSMTIQLNQFKAAIFDLDGVITDTAPLHFRAWKKLADELDIEFNEQDNENLKGVGRIESLEWILQHGGKQLTDAEKQRYASQKNEDYKESLKQLTAQDILPGVSQFLARCRDQGLRIGLASASRNAPAILDALGLNEAFDCVANAGLARSKPAPDIFLFAAYELGIAADQCIAFEDAIAGLQAIKSASMTAVSVGSDELADFSDVHVRAITECLHW